MWWILGTVVGVVAFSLRWLFPEQGKAIGAWILKQGGTAFLLLRKKWKDAAYLLRYSDAVVAMTKREIEQPAGLACNLKIPTVEYGFDPNFMARVMGTTPEVGVCSHTPGEVTVAVYHGGNGYFPNFTRVPPSTRVTAAYQGAGFCHPPGFSG